MLKDVRAQSNEAVCDNFSRTRVRARLQGTVEIKWSPGIVERVRLFEVDEEGAWIVTDETWRNDSLPRETVQYRAFTQVVETTADKTTYELRYRKDEQTDPEAIQFGIWGVSRISFYVDGSAEAIWTDDSGSEFKVPRHRVNVVDTAITTANMRNQPIRNSTSLTGFLASLNCSLNNPFHWSSASADNSRVIFNLWNDEILSGGKYVLLPKEVVTWKNAPGAHVLRRHSLIATAPSVEVFGVICYPANTTAKRRRRAYFNELELVRLHIEEIDGALIATLGDFVPVQAIISGVGHPGAASNPVNDLDPPLGQLTPRVVVTAEGTRYVRDAMVRQYVLRRAQGRCEWCNARGFLLPNDERYLECHHVRALSADGPDTVGNVIAICPNDHRQAHFGADKEHLEMRMLKRIAERNREPLSRNR